MIREYVICVVFFAFSVFMTVQDIKSQKVSRWCSVALLVVMIVSRIFFCDGNERSGFIASAFLGLGLFEAVRLIVKKKLGLADVFYSGSAGALLGFDMWLAMCFIACIVAASVIFFRIRRSAHEKNTRDILMIPVPFIPCLFVGSIVSKTLYFFI
ncbi:MAG: prepilin peptidase [Treponemataceae bacterium]|nr:prepilin peptidase [Treponemataceae bacterium]